MSDDSDEVMKKIVFRAEKSYFVLSYLRNVKIRLNIIQKIYGDFQYEKNVNGDYRFYNIAYGMWKSRYC